MIKRFLLGVLVLLALLGLLVLVVAVNDVEKLLTVRRRRRGGEASGTGR